MITTGSNELMADIHERMPVILRPEHFAAWLDPANQARRPRWHFDPPAGCRGRSHGPEPNREWRGRGWLRSPGLEHLGESRILVQAQGLGATESVNGITVVGKQGDRLAAEVQMPLLQPEQGGLQFEFVTPGHRNSARGDQRVAVRSREDHRRQATVALQAGVAEDQPAVGEAAGHAAWQRT